MTRVTGWVRGPGPESAAFPDAFPMKRILALALLALSLAAPAAAQSDFQRHALTVSMIEKHGAATKDLQKVVKRKKEDDDGDRTEQTVDELVKELDATLGVKPVLARHGLSTREYALTTLALFQAGFYLAMEPSMDKKKGAQLLASYPAETRANIELLRKNPQLFRK